MTRRQFLKIWAKLAVGGFLAAAGGGYATQAEQTRLTVENIQIPLKNLAPGLEGFKIVQMSDLHLHPYVEISLIRAAVTLSNSLKPDIVVLTGDFVLREVEAVFELAPVLAGLETKYGIFAVLGNHDHWTNAEVVRTGLERSGISVLHNQSKLLEANRGKLYLAGVDDGWSGHPDLRAALTDVPANHPTILLAHEPDLVDQFAQDGRVSLQLSGHSHGGQVRLPGIGALVLPYLGKKYDIGLHRVQDTWVYTNRGLGVIWPPVRFNCRPEITEITLIGV